MSEIGKGVATKPWSSVEGKVTATPTEKSISGKVKLLDLGSKDDRASDPIPAKLGGQVQGVFGDLAVGGGASAKAEFSAGYTTGDRWSVGAKVGGEASVNLDLGGEVGTAGHGLGARQANELGAEAVAEADLAAHWDSNGVGVEGGAGLFAGVMRDHTADLAVGGDMVQARGEYGVGVGAGLGTVRASGDLSWDKVGVYLSSTFPVFPGAYTHAGGGISINPTAIGDGIKSLFTGE